MLSSTNFWMCFAGIIYLVAGVLVIRKEVISARGWDKLIAFGCVFVAVPLHLFWAYFVGCALLAAATSLTLSKFIGLSSALLGSMFLLFVLTIHLPNALAHPKDRFVWAVVLRDLSFSGGAWALAGLHRRASSPQQSKWMILFGRIVIALAAIFYAVEHFLHPEFAPGVPLAKMMPSWVPLASLWGYAAGVVLLAAGIGLVLNKRARMAAASIGALMAILTVFPYLVILILARNGSTPEITEAINYVADTLLASGVALALASALPREGIAG
jgi:uncharacterized membrane protein